MRWETANADPKISSALPCRETAGGAANGCPDAHSGRAPLGDGWSEHDWAVRRDRTREANDRSENYFRIRVKCS